MTKDFEIDGAILQVDKKETKKFYLTEIKITDNCNCDDCYFYANTLIKQPFEIFQMLSEMGVDLEKNLSSDQEGAWCVRDDNGELIHCKQECQMLGTMTGNKNVIKYSKFENGYRVNAMFDQFKPDGISVLFQIDRVSDENVIIKFQS